MTQKVNPPPIKIPQVFAQDRELAGFFKTLLKSFYLVWERQGSGGVLAVADGGTGSDTASGARANLDVYSTSEVDTAISTSETTLNTTIANSSIDDRRYSLLVG